MSVLAAPVGRLARAQVLARPLSESMAALLREGDVQERYVSRSEAVMATAVAAVCAGWVEADWRAALEASALGEWATHRRRRGGGQRPRNGGDVERRLGTTWRKARELVRRRPPTSDHFSVRAELAEVLGAADGDPTAWARAAGVTDRAVLAALVEVAAGACTLTPSASTRQLSEAANVSPGTVWKSLNRLVAAGWVRQESAAAGIHAPTWRLLRPQVTPQPAGEVEAVLDTVPARSLAASARSHDVFSHTIHGGLGRVAARLYDLLAAPGRSGAALDVEQLVALTGLHPRTVARHLQALAEVGLVEVGLPAAAGRGWVRTDACLDEVALELGCAGVTEVRRRRHADQRAAFVVWRTDHDARRGWAVQRGLYRPDQPRLPVPLPRAA